MEATFNPSVFDQADLAEARRIILTGTVDADTEARWASETPYVADLAAERLGDLTGRVVLDYGCGVGRIARALVERHKCTVIGVDSSPDMRALAPRYFPDGGFSVVSRRALEAMAARGFKADAAVCVWVLQHCAKPAEDLRLMRAATAGGLFLVNLVRRAVPTVELGWADDGIDIKALAGAAFRPESDGRLDPAAVGRKTAEAAFWATYR